MSVNIIIQFNNKQLTLPINPEELNISRNSDNEDINIVGLGKTTKKDAPGLINLTIESFFPGSDSYFYKKVSPKNCIDFINEIWNTPIANNKVAKIITYGLPTNLNMYFIINSFTYDHKAGEENDIYYTLEIKQYIPYGVKTVTTNLSGLAAARAVSPVSPAPVQTQPVNRTYTVVSGDCLWNITSEFTGDGSRWPELYELNKEVIGSNPSLIYPNQVLTLPVGW